MSGPLTNGQKSFINWVGVSLIAVLAIVSSVSYAHTTFVMREQYKSDMSRLEEHLIRIEHKIDALQRRGPMQGR